MELNTQFETYISLDDGESEYKVEVTATGKIVEDGFTHEFGFKKETYIDNVELVSVYNLESEELIPLNTIGKKAYKELTELAYDYLEDDITNVENFEDDHYEI